jgi:phage-related protein
MASEAEVDLVISTAGALPDLERQLTHIIDELEAGADEIDVQANLDLQQTIDTMTSQLDRAIAAVDSSDPTIDVEAALDLRESLTNLREDVDIVVRDVNNGLDPLSIPAGLNFAESLRDITRDVEFLVEDVERSQELQLRVELDEERIRNFREQIENLDASTSRFSLRGAASLRTFATALAGLTVAGGSAVNALVGVALAVEQLAPAAAVGTSAILTQKLALGTLKLALLGVADAVKSAFDPNVKPEKLAKQIEALAPEAQKFVKQLQDMRKELTGVQQGVQNRFFQGLDEDLKSLANTLGPTVTPALNRTADSLNNMARSAVGAALQLGKSGVLGQALTGATTALQNLEKVPARAVSSFGFLAAAASPALDRITTAVDKVSLRIQDKLAAAFKSGALEKAIDGAIDTFAQLGRTLGNFGSGLRNIFDLIGQSGGGLFFILERVSQAFEDLTKTQGFQDALLALSKTASVVANTVLPLLSQAIQALGPIFKIIAPPIQTLVKTLGDAFGKVLTALAPVLEAAAKAVGTLVVALSPLLTLAGELIAAILPALTPVFEAFAKVFELAAPFVKALADTLSSFLVPILKGLAPIVEALLIPFTTLWQTVLPKLTEILEKLRPSFERVGEAIGRVLELAGPIIAKFVELGIQILGKLLPAIQPLIDTLIFLAEGALKGVAKVLEQFVIPALEVLTKFLNGDFQGAIKQSHEIVDNFQQVAVEAFLRLRNRAVAAVTELVSRVTQKATEMRNEFVHRVLTLVNDAVGKFRELPGRIVAAVGDLSSVLFRAGQNVIDGLAAGIQSKVGGLLAQAANIANSIVSTINGALDIHSPSRKTHKTGTEVVTGLANGMKDTIGKLMKVATQVAQAANIDISQVSKNFTPTAALTPLPTFTGKGTNVVNVYIGNQLVKQLIDDSFKSLMSNRERGFAQGVRI